MMRRAAKATATGGGIRSVEGKSGGCLDILLLCRRREEDLLFSRVEKNVNDGGTKQTTSSFCCFGDGE